MPKDSWQVTAAMNTVGAALGKLGKYQDTERLRLADLYTEWGKPDEARKYYGIN